MPYSLQVLSTIYTDTTTIYYLQLDCLTLAMRAVGHLCELGIKQEAVSFTKYDTGAEVCPTKPILDLVFRRTLEFVAQRCECRRFLPTRGAIGPDGWTLLQCTWYINHAGDWVRQEVVALGLLSEAIVTKRFGSGLYA